jgi:hypothetical protein
VKSLPALNPFSVPSLGAAQKTVMHGNGTASGFPRTLLLTLLNLFIQRSSKKQIFCRNFAFLMLLFAGLDIIAIPICYNS